MSLAAGRYRLSGIEGGLSGSTEFEVLEGGEIAVELTLTD